MNSNNVPVVPGARYKHFKGGIYRVQVIATHTETNEKLVVYQSLGDERKY